MKKVLAVTLALMMAFIVLTPALGYSSRAAGNQSYTAKSGAEVENSFKIGEYSFKSEAPAHNITPKVVNYKRSSKAMGVQSIRVPATFKSGATRTYSTKIVDSKPKSKTPAVQSTRVPPTFKLGNGKTYSTETAETERPYITPGVQSSRIPSSFSLEGSEYAVAIDKFSSAVATEEAATETDATAAVVETPPAKEAEFSIEGTLFEDHGDGTMDYNEKVLAGWTVNLEQPAGTVIQSTITDKEGKFAFTGLSEGEYVVSEAIQTGWNAIYPAEGKITRVITNESATCLVFANELLPVAPVVEAPPVEQPKLSIEGIAFDDRDGNGLNDNNDTGLADWTINLEQPAGIVITTQTTGSDGKFAFTNLTAGEYTISESIPTDWKAVFPSEGKSTMTITNESVTNLIFANQMVPATVVPENATPVVEQPKFSIEGIAFEDKDGNAVIDNNETGLAGWTINLEQPAGTVIRNLTTGTDGKFAFMDLSAGEYTVSEVILMGWNLISPAEGKFTRTVTNESVTGLMFANQVIPAAPENVMPPTNETAMV